MWICGYNVCLENIADKLFPRWGVERQHANNVRRRRRLQLQSTLGDKKKKKTSLPLLVLHRVMFS
jgi:hypothetical protein